MPRLFGWVFATVFCTVPALVLLFISSMLQGELDRSLSRLQHLDALPAGERLVTGEVQPAAGAAVLLSPATGRACVAWRAAAGVTWLKRNTSTDRSEEDSTTMRRGAASIPLTVTDARAGVVATVDGDTLELQTPTREGDVPALPGWALALPEVGSDHDDLDNTRHYWWTEQILEAGTTVSFFARSGDPVQPLTGETTLKPWAGTPEQWRASLEAQLPGAVWTRRIGLVFSVLALGFAAGLLRAWWRQRSGGSST